jgi:LPS-assembly lipoprotein
MQARHAWLSSVVLSGMLLLALAACGFQPLYGQRSVSGGPITQEFAAIRIVPIAERTGQMLYNELRDRLNPTGKPADPRYILQVDLVETREELAYRGDETATRANLHLTAHYQLRRAVSQSTNSAGNDEVVTEGEARITTSYDILESQYATLVSIDDARARSVRVLSDDIRARLATALSPESAGLPVDARAAGAIPQG